LEQIAYNGVGGPEVSGQIDTPWISAATGANGNDKSYLIGAAKTETRTALAAGGNRTTQVNTSFDAAYGMATQIEDLGDTSTAGVRDEQCTRFEYARNTTAWVVDAVSRVENVSLACSATPSRPGDVTSDVRTYYDGATTFGSAPSKGAVTRTEVMTGWGTGPVYTTQNSTGYDVHGRATKATDALGRATTTAYTPVTGGDVDERQGPREHHDDRPDPGCGHRGGGRQQQAHRPAVRPPRPAAGGVDAGAQQGVVREQPELRVQLRRLQDRADVGPQP
jgi:hypothetical protein